KDVVERTDAVGQRCWAGLEDQGRLDLVDMAGSNGGQQIPAGARGDLLSPDFLPAPRRDDDVRMPAHDFLRLDDAILRELRMTQLRKNRIAARDFDQFLNPLDA